MRPNTYVVEHEGVLYGTFDSAEEAYKYAAERGFLPIFISQVLAP